MMMNIEDAAVQTAFTIGSSPELMLLLKLTVLLSAGLATARLLRGARAAVRHLVLAATFAAAAALPLASALLPGVAIPVVGAERDSRQASYPETSAPERMPAAAPAAAGSIGKPALDLSATDVARAAWATGTGVLLAWLALALTQLRRLRRDALPALELTPALQRLAGESGVRRPVALVTHDRVVAPLTCGFRHATILLPEDAGAWSSGELQRALIHELEHVKRFDWPVQMIARLVCAAFWFHPLAWVAWRQLRLEAERACDDAVVRRADTADYAEQLVGLARRLARMDSGLSLAMAGRTDLSRRVGSLLDGGQRRGRAGRPAVIGILSASLLVLAALAPMQAVASDGAESASLIVAGDVTQVRPGRRPMSLYRAASRGNVERMNELIDSGANVNEAIDGDGSPLIGAARGGHLAAVKLLLDRGADPNLAVEGDGNALIMAAREGHADVVKLLLDRGAMIDQAVAGDETALIQASAENRVAVVRLLLERRADPNIRVWSEGGTRGEGEWRTALSQARRGGHAAVVRLLIAAGARE